MKMVSWLTAVTLAATMMVSAWAETNPSAPAEIVAAAPAGTTLLTFKSSADPTHAYALAVYETPPDEDNVRHRSLIIFGSKDGKFVPEVTNDKLIACSKCSQFHDDPFDGDYFKLTPGHIHTNQMDGGEKPSTTIIDFAYRHGKWYVGRATRESVAVGRYETVFEKLPLPKSGLAQDMDGHWSVPTYFNGIVVNDTTGKFSFLHSDRSHTAFQQSATSSCDGKDCRVVVMQQDGCFSLVRDSSGKSFGAGSPNPKVKADAVSKAMTECTAAGGQACKEIRTDCTEGVL